MASGKHNGAWKLTSRDEVQGQWEGYTEMLASSTEWSDGEPGQRRLRQRHRVSGTQAPRYISNPTEFCFQLRNQPWADFSFSMQELFLEF